MRRRVACLTAMAIVAVACGGEVDDTAVGGSALTVERFDDFGNEHFPEAEVDAIVAGSSDFEYETSPATSGPHAPVWAPCGVYRETVPEVFSVHSMEHGAVVIHYEPTLSESERDSLEGVAREMGSHVVVTPRAGLGSDVVLTAWTVMARLDGVDLASIRSFWEDHAQNGPERIPCPIEVDQSS